MADTADAPVAIFKKRSANTSNLRKRAATPPSDSPYSDSDVLSDNDTADAPQAKRPRKAGSGVLTSSTADASKQTGDDRPDIIDVLGVTKYSADRSANIDVSNDATKQSNWFDEKSLLGSTRSVSKQQSSQKPPGTMGPVKAPTNVRTITVIDFAPDVCKDYKQTGFCGYGDNCKFLHAREDYAQGWTLDKEWEIKTKGQKKLKGTVMASRNGLTKEEKEDEAEVKELEKIPFKCIICKEDYKEPIVTRCGHYFCESCAVGRYKKTPTCAACGEGTNGTFNIGRNLKKLLEKKRSREERLKEEEAGENEDEDDD
jgi:RING finger protein 113A